MAIRVLARQNQIRVLDESNDSGKAQQTNRGHPINTAH